MNISQPTMTPKRVFKKMLFLINCGDASVSICIPTCVTLLSRYNTRRVSIGK